MQEGVWFREIEHTNTVLLGEIYLVLYIVEAHKYLNKEYVYKYQFRKSPLVIPAISPNKVISFTWLNRS